MCQCLNQDNFSFEFVLLHLAIFDAIVKHKIGVIV